MIRVRDTIVGILDVDYEFLISDSIAVCFSLNVISLAIFHLIFVSFFFIENCTPAEIDTN